jgi:hypothetical protein
MTGQDVGAVYMPAPQTGSPMTYLHNGKQYLVLAIAARGTAANCWRSNCRIRGPARAALRKAALSADVT